MATPALAPRNPTEDAILGAARAGKTEALRRIAAALANMTTSPQREIRRSGDDPETIRQEIEEHQAWCAARGLAYPGLDVSAPDAPAAENAT